MTQYTNKINFIKTFFKTKYDLKVIFLDVTNIEKNYTHHVVVYFDRFMINVCKLEADWVEWENGYILRFIEAAICTEFKRAESILGSYARCITVLKEASTNREAVNDDERMDEINNSFIMQRFTRRV